METNTLIFICIVIYGIVLFAVGLSFKKRNHNLYTHGYLACLQSIYTMHIFTYTQLHFSVYSPPKNKRIKYINIFLGRYRYIIIWVYKSTLFCRE